ncbi:hypothetical protein [Pectobacterium brasiliense]|uniref:hypothetical protein n=1 Tax=Pectobacterium brasiliense TaxID=180957 RepID=UPI0025A18169|nr:hypothetical protein [Pectobacterium brasiliense]WJM80528.1 hypothetical protein QTI90_20045 [Pectobacterium brasiliense]
MSLAKVDKQEHPKICSGYQSGKTLRELSMEFSVSMERIRQILKENGLSGRNGGIAAKIAKREADKKNRHMKKFGCSKEQLKEIGCHHSKKSKSPLHAFLSQKRNAKNRGVEWRLSFWEWWSIWQESGKWESRGRGEGHFCMCRIGDAGAYDNKNVYIGSVVHNSTLGKTLALERGVRNTFIYRLIKTAGGTSHVSSEISVNKNYLAQLVSRNLIPKSWLSNGKAKKLAELTAGSITYEQIVKELAA